MLLQSRFIHLICIFALAIAVSLASAPANTEAATTTKANPIKINLNGNAFQPETAPFIHNGTVYLPVRDIGELLDTVVFWNSSNKTVTMTYPNLTIQLTYGSLNAKVNGQTVKLTAPLQNVNSRIFIPLRFLSESTGATVDWVNPSKTVNITQKNNELLKVIGTNITAWLNKHTGEFYFAYPYEQAPTLVGKVNHKIQGSVSFTFNYIDKNNFHVTMLDNYGEPRVHYDAHQFLISDGKIVDEKKASYFKRYERNQPYYESFNPQTNSFDTYHLLTDDQIVSIYNNNGEKVKEYNLPKLTGKDESFAIFQATNDYLIVRPNSTGFLTLIDLENKSVVELYEKLLSGNDLAYAKTNDVPYRGDELQFVGTDGDNELYFYYNSPIDGKDEIEELTYIRKAN